MKFSELDLHPALVTSIEKLNFVECTPVQEAAIPHILNGKDVAGLAQTGTGKTAAYLVPLIERILTSQKREGSVPENKTSRTFKDWKPNNFILILVPTRELAEQVLENVNSLGQEAGLKAAAVYGGTSYEPQKKALGQGVDFVVATPGRLIDLFKEHVVDLGQVRAVVFDEADRMFDMGFKDDMKFILRRVPRDRQFLVFSATLNFDVLNVAYEFGADPVEIDVSRDQAKAENVDDELFHLGSVEKPRHLLTLLKKNEPRQAIIFSNFKNNVERLTQFLNQNGIPAVGISSLLSQAQRNRVMAQFKAANDRNILVATDVAARGLDIKGVDLVINYELPDDPENYVHRIGRTGRAGAPGKAYSLVSDRDVDALTRIEEYLGHKIKTGWLDDTELVSDFKEFPSENSYLRPQRPRPEKNGPRRNGDRRPPRRDSRPSRGEGKGRRPDRRGNDHQRRETSAETPRSASSGGMHRDRLTGRHAKPPSNREFSKRNGQQHRFDKKTKKIYRGGRYRVEQPPPTLGQKISSFFKNLFGK